MKQFYDFIKAKIEADLTDIKTVRLWRNQYSSYNIDKMESVFRYPAIFIEFTPTEYFEYKQYRDVDLIVRFHVGIENYMIEKEEDLDLIDKIDRAFKGFRGNTDDAVNFTTFEKIVESDDPDDDNVNLIIVEYKTRFREIDSLPGDTIVVDPVALDLDAEIVSEIKNPPFAVRCIAANNEYLSSPNFNPFPNGVSDVDIEFTLEPSIIDGVKYLIYSDIETGFDAYQLTISTASDTIIFSMRNNGNLNVTNFNGIAGTSLNNGGKIGIKYNATTGDIDMFWDDILISSVTPTTNAFTGVTTEPLVFFGRNQTGAGISATYDGSVSYIKIGSKEWKSFNWKSPITTNSQGVQTTLHSDDNTDAMIIEI